MTLTVNRKYDITLDAQWTSDILVTAFDAQYGGALYWMDEEDVRQIDLVKDGNEWSAIRLNVGEKDGLPTKVMILDNNTLSHAIERILNEDKPTKAGERPLVGSCIRKQLRDAIEEEDAGNIDADVADVIVQVAALGEVVYG